MKTITPTQLRGNVYKFIDDVLATGTPLEIKKGTKAVRIVPVKIEEQNHFEVSPSGYGIHWPLIDEDLSIDGLLGIEHAPILKRKSA